MAEKKTGSKTKAELEQELAELQKQMVAKDKELEAKDEALQQAQSGQGLQIAPGIRKGYLVTTPVPIKSTVTAGVQIYNGRGFIPYMEEVKHPGDKPIEREAADVWGEKKKAYDRWLRHNEVIQSLRSDFKYKVELVTAEELERLRNEPGPEGLQGDTLTDTIMMPAIVS